ncbi:cell division protein SepF [Spiroplasma endosymbiont of Ammophila pubescens]|uniref:cell division protein SepF n=1 Tax=Spiroplasma endosymbiont of Ammophila pubescens TaxID=3066315 RepID=UPI0032B2BA29
MNFERESEVQPSSEVSSNTSVLTTGFIADSYNDAPKMADLLLTKGQLIVHLEKLPKEEWVRLLDFISGVWCMLLMVMFKKMNIELINLQFKKILNKTQLL